MIKRTIVLLAVLGFVCDMGSANGQQPRNDDESVLPDVRLELARRAALDREVRRTLVKAAAWLVARKDNAAGDTHDEIDAKLEMKLCICAMCRAVSQGPQRQVERVSTENSAWLKRVVNQYGWLGKTLVGDDGAHNAWLLAQHSDSDPVFQARCLTLMRDMAPSEVSRVDIAYLTDRVRVSAGEPQEYGTQIRWDGKTPFAVQLEHDKSVDARRKAMGMEPITAYLSRISKNVENRDRLQSRDGKKPRFDL